MKRKAMIQMIAAITLFVGSWWCLLWMFASADLAFLACDGYSLLHEQFRCRQPNIAMILWLVSGVGCVMFLYFGIKNLNRASRNAT